MAHALYQVGIKALITDEQGRLLLFKSIPYGKDPAHWDLAGGRMEDDQTPEETLHREMLEETGITDVETISFFGGCFSNIRIPVEEGKTVGLMLMAYQVKIPAGSPIRLSEEHTEYTWVTSAEAADMLSYKYPKEFTELLK